MSDKKERTIIDLTSLQIKTKPLEGSKRPATLAVKVWNNKVSMTTYTNVEGLPKNGIIGLNLYPIDFFSFLSALEDVIKTPYNGARNSKKMEVFDKLGQDAQLLGTITFGRDDNGFIYVCMVSPMEEMPKAVFRLDFPRTIKVSGYEHDYQTSEISAQAWIDWWREVIPGYIADHFVDESNNGQGGGGFNRNKGNGGGYNNNRNNGGGYNNNNRGGNQRSTDNYADDDLPFD